MAEGSTGRRRAPERPRRPGRERGQATRERVLDVAEERFAARGFAGTGLRELASAAGIQQPSLYRHFDSKADLYAAVLERALRPVIDGLDRWLADEPDAPDSDHLASWVVGVLAERPHVGRLLLHEVASTPRSLSPVVRRAFEPVFERALRVIARASGGTLDRSEASLWLVALFFAGAGYFAASPILELVGGGRPVAPSMLMHQRRVMSDLEDALRRRMRERRSTEAPPVRAGGKERW